MTPELWQKVEQLFQAATALPRTAQRAYLEEVCADDRELREILQRMLLAHEHSSSLLDTATFAGARSLEPGTRIGPYLTEGKIGEGGMGEVFGAVDTRLNRRVAIKICQGRFGERFQRECLALSALNHPHICTLYDVGPDYLVMELVEGPTLAARIQDGPLPITEVLRYGAEIADALAEAHAAGIVHRDLKPRNIMISRHGAKVLDFGIAKLAAGPELTVTGGVIGTPGYLAPEQISGQQADARSDLFALGLVLYEMVAGTLPIPGTSLGRVLAAGGAVPTLLAKTVRDIPARLSSLAEQLLQRDPERRPASAAAVRDELRNIASPGKSRFGRLRWIAAAAAVAVAIAAAWSFHVRAEGPSFEVDSVRTLVPLPGIEYNPAISPDGSMVAFSWAGETGDQRTLHTIPMSGGSYRRITSGPGRDYVPAWSPDGRQIAFLRSTGVRQLILLDVASGQQRVLLPDLKMGTQVSYVPSPPAWTPDGKAVLVPMSDFETGKTSLFVVNAKDAAARRLFPSPAGLEGDTLPSLSPDGHWLAYVSMNSPLVLQLTVRHMGLDLRPDGEPILVPEASGRISSAVWAPAADRLYFGRNAQIVEWKRAGGSRILYHGAALVGGLSAVWDEGVPRFVFSPTPLGGDVRSLQLQEGGMRFAGQPVSFLHSAPTYPFTPSFSPDGRLITYVGKTPEENEIWVANADGTNHRQLTHGAYRDITFPMWSPSGKEIVFNAIRDGQLRHIYLVALHSSSGSPVRQLTHSDVMGFGLPFFSRDGKFVYAEALNHQLVRIPEAAGQPESLMEGFVPRETEDGRLLYCKDGKFGIFGRSLAGDIATNPEEKLVDDYLPPIPPIQVFANGVYYLGRSAGGPLRLRFYSFATHRPVDVGELNTGETFSVSPDRRRLIYAAPVTDGIDLTVVEMRRAR